MSGNPGITLFDTAPVYGTNGGESEEILGRALGNRRKDTVVVTKFGVPQDRTGRFNTSRAAIMEEIDASLLPKTAGWARTCGTWPTAT